MLRIPSRLVHAGLSAAAVTVTTAFLAALFPPELMLAATTTTGGDMASHTYAAAMTRDLLWEHHRLTGWVPGNYAGFPLFQMYFPLPFAVIALLSGVIDPNVAFKLVSVAGVIALPGTAYFALSRLGIPFPAPGLGAIFVVLFLVQGGNTMWGGNLYSTLAGEFAYSISLPLALLVLGLHERALASVRWTLVCGGLIALVALTHAYTVLWLALSSLLVVVIRGELWRALAHVASMYAAAGALCAWWLLPLLWYTPWTTAYQHLWVMQSIADTLPPPLVPMAVAAALSPALLRVLDRPALREYRDRTALLHAAALAALAAYAAAPSFGIVDVRFLPFLQLMLCLLAAAGTGYVVRRWQGRELWIPIGCLAAMLAAQPELPQIDRWVRWNYEGFEPKPLWPVYAAMADHLRGDAADPRVAFEHSPDHEVFGTTRAFENLPLFAGRSTLEGVNMQASVTAPFVFYVQSEISHVMSCPFPDWGCSRPDLAAGVEHLRMLHVSQIILRSDTMKAAAAREPALARDATFGAYEIFRIVDAGEPARYALHLDAAPYAVIARDWKSEAYRWFKRARAGDPMPIFVPQRFWGGARHERALPAGRLAGVFETLPPSAPHVELGPVPPLRERIERERITIEGTLPGRPLLVRVAYHPRWRATTGEPVWLAGPGFMLVFPEGDRVELVYGEGWPEWMGRITTALAMAGALVVLGAVGNGRIRWPAAANATQNANRLASVSVVACVLLLAGAGTRARHTNAEQVYRRGQQQLDRGETAAAHRSFLRARQLAPLSNSAIHSSYYSAIILYRDERWNEARDAFLQLVHRFPEAHAAAEALYHAGLCADRAGRPVQAVEAFAETVRRFPGTMWADYASTRLRERRAGLETLTPEA